MLGLLGCFGCQVDDSETPPEEGPARNVSGKWVMSGGGTFTECKNPDLNGVDFTFSSSNLAWNVAQVDSGPAPVGGAPSMGGAQAGNQSTLAIMIPGDSSAKASGTVRGSTVRIEYSDIIKGFGPGVDEEGKLSLIFSGLVTEVGDIDGTFSHGTDSDCQVTGRFSVSITASGSAITGGAPALPGGQPAGGFAILEEGGQPAGGAAAPQGGQPAGGAAAPQGGQPAGGAAAPQGGQPAGGSVTPQGGQPAGGGTAASGGMST